MSKIPLPRVLKFADIKIGSNFEFERIITKKDILTFAKLTGDFNPIHVDSNFKNPFGRNIVHGMLASSLFSTLVGMYLPGKYCLYLSQEIQFTKPVFPDKNLLVRGTVTAKTESLKMLTIKTEIFMEGNLVVKGIAKVKVLK